MRIFEYQPAMMHAKTIVVDGAVAVRGQHERGQPLDVVQRGEQISSCSTATIGAKMEAMFLDDMRYAEEIDLATFSKRPLTERVGEHACHLIWRVL